MYTKTFLRKVHARYYQLPNEELSRVISDYFFIILRQKRVRNRLEAFY